MRTKSKTRLVLRWHMTARSKFNEITLATLLAALLIKANSSLSTFPTDRHINDLVLVAANVHSDRDVLFTISIY